MTLTMAVAQFPGQRDFIGNANADSPALIEGTIAVGSTIRAFMGSEPYRVAAPTDLSDNANHQLPANKVEHFQWYRNGVKIKGATRSEYTFTAADRGKRLRVVAAIKYPGFLGSTRTSRDTGLVGDAALPGSNFNGNVPPQAGIRYRASATGSTVTLVAPEPGEKPTGAGTEAVAYSLDGLKNLDVPRTYQWYRNGAAIKGATKSSYVVPAKWATHRFTVRISVRKAGYTELYSVSPGAAIALQGGSARLGAAPRVGQAVTAVVSAATASPRSTVYFGDTCRPWKLWFIVDPSDELVATCQDGDTPGISTSYQWLRSGEAIAGATGETYTPTAADRGKKLSVRVTFREITGTYFARTVTSAAAKVR